MTAAMAQNFVLGWVPPSRRWIQSVAQMIQKTKGMTRAGRMASFLGNRIRFQMDWAFDRGLAGDEEDAG
jgi:hypothetical protein